MNDQDPAEMLAAAVKALRWSGFLLAGMLAILLIDLQLKRSIGRQAVTAADKLAGINRMCDQILADLRKGPGGGRQDIPAAASSRGDAGLSRGDGVDGTAPGAAGTDGAAGPVKAPRRSRAAGPGVRAAGNGTGTGGDTGA